MEIDTREVVFNEDAIIPPRSPRTDKEVPVVPSSNIPQSTILEETQNILGKEGVSLLGNLVDDIVFEEKLQEIDCDLWKFNGEIQVSEAVKFAMNSIAATIQPTTHVSSIIRKDELT